MKIPSGWYYGLQSKEIKPGQVLGKKLFDQNLVIWRTQLGQLNVSHATCPHRGSDLSKLGSVEGENLKCFSHDYEYNDKGDCVKTALPILPCNPQAALKSYPVHEIAGFILIWFDANGRAPTWTIPDKVFSAAGTGKFVKSQYQFNCSVETINEDNFDVGHLYKWHSLDEVNSTLPSVEGPTISVVHDFRRHSILFGKKLRKPFDLLSKEIVSRYGSTLYGHGLTWSFIDLPAFDFHVQDFIWATPIDAETTLYTTFLRRQLPTKTSSWSTKIRNALHPALFGMFVFRLRMEHRHEGHGFWENQSAVPRPILTSTERKMLEPYWQWCAQFDPEGQPRASVKTKYPKAVQAAC